MTRTVITAIAAILVLCVVAGTTMAVPADETDPPAASIDDHTPGELLSTFVVLQGDELEVELLERSFGVAIVEAGTDETRAGVVAAQLDGVEQRLSDLEQRIDTLERRHAAGEIGDARYRAELTRAVASLDHLERLVAVVELRADRLPDERQREGGVTSDRFAAIDDRVSTAMDADDRDGIRRALDERMGEPADRFQFVELTLDRTDQRIIRASDQVGDDELALRYLERATAEYEDGVAAYRNAVAAAEAGDDRLASRYLSVSMNHAHTANALVTRAVRLAESADPDDADRQALQWIDRADRALSDATAVVERAWGYRGVGDNPDAVPYLERADASLEEASQALEDARTAYDRGEYRRAIRHANHAIELSGEAEAFAERALYIGGIDGDEPSDADAEAVVNRAASTVDTVATLVERAQRQAGGDPEAREYLDRAWSELGHAQHAVGDARLALSEGDPDRAKALAETAHEHAAIAERNAMLAMDAAGGEDVDEDTGDRTTDRS